MASALSTVGAPIGRWRGDSARLTTDPEAIRALLHRVHTPLFAVQHEGRVAYTDSGEATVAGSDDAGLPLLALAPAGPARQLGDPSFARSHGLKLNYVAGAMAGGIASVELVEAMARAGMLGVFGAAGLDLATVEAALVRLSTHLLDRPWAANLIHSPYEPTLEEGIVDLYLRRGVKLISASAYLDLTLPLLRYRLHGLHRNSDGTVVAPNRVLGKVSRVEVAEKFLSPPPPAMLRALVETGQIHADTAMLAASIPVADDLIVEADSGGHTDNRPALTLLPTMLGLRARMAALHGYRTVPRVGAAGGIGTPAAAAAAFTMGRRSS